MRTALCLALLAACGRHEPEPVDTGDTDLVADETDTDTDRPGPEPDTDTDTDDTGVDTGGTPVGPVGVDALQAGDLVITEIMQNPSVVEDELGEWFELRNASGAEVDLAGLVVRSADGTQTFTVGPLVVPADAHVVLGSNGDLGTNGGVPVDFAYLPSAFTLGNDHDQILLQNAALTIDEVVYDGGPAFPDPTGASMRLDPSADATTNDLGRSWCVAVTPYGDGDLGTPGAANPPCPVDTSAPVDTGPVDTGLDTAPVDTGPVDTAPPAPAPADLLSVGDVVITELMKNPKAVDDAFGEWIEVHNPTAIPIDLEGLVVSDAGGETFTVAGRLVVSAGGWAVLAVNGDAALNGGVAADYVYPGTFLLGNGNDEVILSNASGVLDEIQYDNGAGWPDPNGSSIGLDPTLLDPVSNDLGANWCAATAAFGGGDLGTPGAANDPC